MSLKRKASLQFEEWLKSSNKVLLVDGARQTGKTFLISEFLHKKFKHVLEINVLLEPDFIDTMKGTKGFEDFMTRLSAFSNHVPFVPNETAIFIDEIQALQDFDIVTLSKAFALDGRFRWVLSGSLLGVSLKHVVSWPIGYMTQIKMYPLDFEEFLWAKGCDESFFSGIKKYYEKLIPLPEALHKQLLEYFYLYLLIGGMPQAVKRYFETFDLREVNLVKQDIDSLLRNDIHSYVEIEKRPLLNKIYEMIPEELNSKSKRFHITAMTNNPGRDKISDDFNWFTMAGIAIPVYNVKSPELPLRMNTERNLLKLFMLDVGMLNFELMDTDVQRRLLKHELDINYGSIFENFVAQELNSHNFKNLYYFNSKKMGEVDFIVQYKGKSLPIEVKSGKDYEKHKAINNLIDCKEYGIEKGIVFSVANLSVTDKIIYLPIYMVDFFDKLL